MMGIPACGRSWLAGQSKHFLKLLEAFAAGVNACVDQAVSHLDDDLRRVLPIQATDILCHSSRFVHFRMLTSQSRLRQTLGVPALLHDDGSNAWAIAPGRSSTGNALLGANPHLTWSDVCTFFEVHLLAPGIEQYGATQVGFPVLRYSFNRSAGFAQTVNPIASTDLYRLPLSGADYLYDGKPRRFDVRRERIVVRRANGAATADTLEIRRSVHGPVIWDAKNRAIAIRVAGLDRARMLEQYWRMGNASCLAEFQSALRLCQIPLYNSIYADVHGDIFYAYGGAVPRRHATVPFHRGILAGHSPEALWSDTHGFDELPRVANPTTGFLQNTNDAPWSCTYPAALDPTSFPAYFPPLLLSFRTQQSLRLLSERSRWSLDDLCELKHCTAVEMGIRLRDDLIGLALGSGSAVAARCGRVLADWDLTTNAASRGAVLFHAFAGRFAGPEFRDHEAFREPFDPARPLCTPRGIRDPHAALKMLEDAAREVEAKYGALDVPWGQVFRFRVAGLDLPGNGGFGNLGILRTITYHTEGDHAGSAYHGDSYVCCIEFGRPIRAFSLLGYGNWSQPDSSHRIGQLHFMQTKSLRPALLERAAVEASCTDHEWLK
jgi:acyl-homoserine-lactone acylase